MTMKTKYISIKLAFGMVCLLLAIGCNDYLDITPPSSVSPEVYFKTEDQLASYIIKYYADDNYSNYLEGRDDKGGRLPYNYGIGSSYYMDDAATDNALYRSASNSRFLINGMDGEWLVDGSGGKWNFSNIYPLNYYIKIANENYKAGAIQGNADNIKQYIGEGYFLRAHEYFFRLRKLGDFPIITTVLPDIKDSLVLHSRRDPRNEVARFILKDLDQAIEYLKENPPGGKNRISKYTALVMKARVALFEATWEKYHAGTALVPNGPGWPGKEKDYNANYQFPSGSIENEINFFLDQALDASSKVADAIALVSNNKVIRENVSDPVNPYYDMFASLNPMSYSEVLLCRSHKVGVEMHGYNQFIAGGGTYGLTKQSEKSFLMQNGLPIYATGSGYKGDDYIQDTKTDRDWRWRLFMKAPGEIRKVDNIITPGYFPAAPTIYSGDSKESTSTGYLQGKGYSLDANQGSTLNNDATATVIFRAAEAYLVYLEAAYLKNGNIDAKADKYWKQLRERSGIDPDYNKTIAATNISQEALNDWGAYSKGQLVDATLYNIRRERRCEFIGEGHRYDDLIRWRAMDQLNGYQIEGCKLWGPIKDAYNPGELTYLPAPSPTVSAPSLSDYFRPYQVVQTHLYYRGLYFTQAHYLFPIAVNHFLDSSSDGKSVATSPIYQNPGWPIDAATGAKD
jgi:hypothetical protein